MMLANASGEPAWAAVAIMCLLGSISLWGRYRSTGKRMYRRALIGVLWQTAAIILHVATGLGWLAFVLGLPGFLILLTSGVPTFMSYVNRRC